MNYKKLMTVKNYSKMVGLTPQRIYQLKEEGKIRFKEIDKRKFVILD
jgi:hypothetical protein